jgi:hemoglobin
MILITFNLFTNRFLCHAMKNDIQDKQDIIQIVNTFYDKVKQDQVIGHFFNSVMKVDWNKHLPKMYNFWDNVVFYTNNYTGNPMQVHKNIHGLNAFSAADFKQWYQLFAATVDELFEGEKAELIKQRALSVATIMQIKIVSKQEIQLL